MTEAVKSVEITSPFGGKLKLDFSDLSAKGFPLAVSGGEKEYLDDFIENNRGHV